MGAASFGDEAGASGVGRLVGRARVAARAALAGNPSDGHGGAVVAVPLDVWAATVEFREPVRADRGRDARPLTIEADAARDEPLDAGLATLVGAALAAGTDLLGMPTDLGRRHDVVVRTDIPRTVGLAGSSAVVIAALRAAADTEPAAHWAVALSDPDVVAVVALAAEVEHLGLAAGLQDRLVQAYGSPLLMEFGDEATHEVLGRPCGTATPLPRPPGRLLVAHRPSAAESSDEVHRGLRRRRDEAPDDLATAMADAAEAGRAAASAILDGDGDRLGAAMDRTFDQRERVVPLRPDHVEMVHSARRAGAHVNYTGSGGAVVVSCRDDATLGRAAEALRRLPGCIVTAL